METVTGFPREFIPSLEEPRLVEDYFGDPHDEVLVLEGGERPRAYPERILTYNHVVNDVYDGEPVLVSHCPLCGSSVTFSRVVDGRELTFGFAGKLYGDNLVVRDRETGSEWKQSTGECLAGAYEGTRLDVRTSRLTTWATLAEDHEPVEVLALPEDRRENDFYRWVHRMNTWAAGGSPLPALFRATVVAWNGLRRLWGGTGTDITPIVYLHDVMTALENLRGEVPEGIETYEHPPTRYADAPFYGFPPAGPQTAWDHPGTEPKTAVLGVEADGAVRGFPRTAVETAGGVVRTTVGETPVVVFAVGDVLTAYEDPGLAFEPGEGGAARADGALWDPLDGTSDDGRQLEPVTTWRSYAFAWLRDHGEARLFDGG